MVTKDVCVLCGYVAMQLCVQFLQVVMYSGNNAKFTTFLIKNKEAFEHYFKQTKCNQDVDKLYTLKDVYEQITLIVDSVSCTN